MDGWKVNESLPIRSKILDSNQLKVVTSKGVAGVPRASLVILLGTLASFHLPVEGVILILGVDELMDMARTAVNVVGNCLATVVITKWEGAFRNDEWQAEMKEMNGPLVEL